MSISHRPPPALSSPPCQVASLFFDPFIHYLLFSPASTLLRSCTRRASLPFLLVLVPSFGARINTSHAGFFFASSRPQHLIAFHPPPLPLAFHPYLDRVASLARRREPVPVHSAFLQSIQSLPGLVDSTRRHCALPNRFLLIVIQHHTLHA